jgi:hypothetical protein
MNKRTRATESLSLEMSLYILDSTEYISLLQTDKKRERTNGVRRMNLRWAHTIREGEECSGRGCRRIPMM